ncbi:PIN domain-containing protein [Muricoccus vinaceus]|uniref:PIN domain-containing protein n=1 Tax=Muricoccus vinaceus TaxID=424704 RepID=A0ABV6IT16_9PROT
MTRFLLDRDVLSQLDQPENKRHVNVRKWFRTVPDNDLYMSAVTVMEGWYGKAKARKGAAGSPEKLANCERFDAEYQLLLSAFQGRIIPVDEGVAKIWGQLRAAKDNHVWDLSLAAAARENSMVIASRNLADLVGRGARVLDPFKEPFRIVDP